MGLARSDPQWAVEFCKAYFGFTEAQCKQIEGDSGRAALQVLWEELGPALYEEPLYLLRQEVWHAAHPTYCINPSFFFTLPHQAVLCDYGCGTAEMSRRWIEMGRKAFLLDTSQLTLNYLDAKYEGCNVLIRDATTYEISWIDAIVCTDVLEHVPAPLALLQKLWQAVKPGGQMAMNMSPAFPHPGHLEAAVNQFDDVMHWINTVPYVFDHHPEGVYAWLMKDNPAPKS